MSRYEIVSVPRGGHRAFALRDAERDALAELAPDIGCNVYRFDVGGVPLLQPPDSLEQLRREPFADFKYGTPILFPPNRVKNGEFRFRERTYKLPLNEPPDHHLHGEICSRAWEVAETGASDEGGAWITCRFRYAEHPDLLAYFPHPLVFTVTYRLLDGELSMEASVANDGADEAPFAFGLHPYFALPFGEGEAIELQLPAEREWPVTNLAFVTGLPAETPLCGELREGIDLNAFPPLGVKLIEFPEGAEDAACRIRMPGRGGTLLYKVGRGFPYVVLFRPDWASAFSLEPYTYVTDAFNLPYDAALTGARGIGPGETLRFFTALALES